MLRQTEGTPRAEAQHLWRALTRRLERGAPPTEAQGLPPRRHGAMLADTTAIFAIVIERSDGDGKKSERWARATFLKHLTEV